jgi:hypothetical protein
MINCNEHNNKKIRTIIIVNFLDKKKNNDQENGNTQKTKD